jgi:DNA-binding transcriptional LysR family regulator
MIFQTPSRGQASVGHIAARFEATKDATPSASQKLIPKGKNTKHQSMYRAGLNDLAAVIAIAKRGSFRAAALDLGVSTTALSNAVGKLEANLGVRLFNRTTRSVSLTDAGRTFTDQVGPALHNIDEAMDVARSQQSTPSGVIRINAFATAGRAIIAPLVIEFVRRHPQVHVDLVTEGRLVDVVADGFDLGVRMSNLIPTDMIALSLRLPRRYAVVAAPAYLAGRDPPRLPTDLLEHQCLRVRLPDGSLYRWEFRNGEKSAEVDVRGPLTLDEASLARIAVLEGMGLGFFMEQDVREDLDAGRMIRVLDDWTPPEGSLCLYYPGRRNPSAALRAFLDLARELAAEAK